LQLSYLLMSFVVLSLQNTISVFRPLGSGAYGKLIQRIGYKDSNLLWIPHQKSRIINANGTFFDNS